MHSKNKFEQLAHVRNGQEHIEISQVYCITAVILFHKCRRVLVGSVLAFQMKSQSLNSRSTKYEKYFFGDFFSADFWQKLWE